MHEGTVKFTQMNLNKIQYTVVLGRHKEAIS